MGITMESLLLGEIYTRKELADLWGYENEKAISRGIITPKGSKIIILFVTRIKQKNFIQYKDYFEGDLLYMEGEKQHGSDNRIIQAGAAGEKIYLFYRERHHQPFVYYGLIQLISFTRNTPSPSEFVFQTNKFDADAQSALRTIEETKNESDFIYEERVEGERKIKIRASYERDRNNRADAIKIHGTTCVACEFNFDQFYGAELARQFIEIHHIKPLSSYSGPISPAIDLVL